MTYLIWWGRFGEERPCFGPCQMVKGAGASTWSLILRATMVVFEVIEWSLDKGPHYSYMHCGVSTGGSWSTIVTIEVHLWYNDSIGEFFTEFSGSFQLVPNTKRVGRHYVKASRAFGWNPKRWKGRSVYSGLFWTTSQPCEASRFLLSCDCYLEAWFGSAVPNFGGA